MPGIREYMVRHSLAPHFLLFVFALVLLNILPLILYNIAGDVDFHLVLIKCFAGQFWQGDLYPRWCMEANAGLGSSQPMFYFPLPFYIASLFYPFSHLGVSLYGVYIMSVFLATAVTLGTCYLWLKDIVSPGRAMLAAIVFIFMPYRMEAMLFRSAYAELWGMALLPLAFLYTRRGQMLPLAAVLGLLSITHLPTAAVAIIGNGIYLLVTSGRAWEPKWRYGLTVLGAIAFSSFYFVPAVYYHRYLLKESADIYDQGHGWPDTYLQVNNLYYQTPLVLMIAITILALSILAFQVVRNRVRVDKVSVQKEICVWGIIVPVALFLLFRISAPIYMLIGPLSQVVLPWRMQQFFMLAMAFFIAVWAQWFATEHRVKTWKMDFTLLLGLLVLLSYSVAINRDAKESRTVTNATIISYPRYHTIWADQDHYGTSYFLFRYAHKNATREAEIASGKGRIKVERWAYDGIVLKTDSAHGFTVRLNQYYFPVWSAGSEDGEPVTLRPEAKTGQMLLDIPAGKHHVTLHYAMSTDKPWMIWLVNLISISMLLLWEGLIYRRYPKLRAV